MGPCSLHTAAKRPCTGGERRQSQLALGTPPLEETRKTIVERDGELASSRCGLRCRDGFRSDTHGYEFRCHYLPHFISNSDTNTNIIECEYKTDISNLDSHSSTYLIYSIE
jgi:hypothetical protein